MIEKNKEISLQLKNNEYNGKSMLVLTKLYDNMLAPELEKLFLFYHIKRQYQGGKELKLVKWKTICTKNQAPPSHEKWTAEDKAKLNEMKKKKF